VPRAIPLTALALVLVTCASLSAQRPEVLPDTLQKMVDTERAFAARALVVGWKQAFLEYFDNRAVGFKDGSIGLAKDQIRQNPDPPPDLQLLWEPRLGDISATGEIGYLTGPSRTILPPRAARSGDTGDNGRPRHAVYASVWKRQRDGSFRVVIDVGVNVPSAAPFAAGFTRPAYKTRFSGDYDDKTPPLGAADGLLNSALRVSQQRALRGGAGGVLAEGARLHRPNVLPIVGERTIASWAAAQPPYALADTRYSEAARSGDLGYTWGTYAIGAAVGTATAAKPARQEGFYVRIWARGRDGQWKLALDVLQPQTSR
jgi:ketosteroid isomerase-like protein